jgi:Glycosyl hydrolases family 2, TIM barrel domain
MIKQFILLLATGLLIASPRVGECQSKVVLKKADGKFQLLRNGQPYEIKGAGGQTHLELLVKLGGNSIRTWGADDIGSVLENAQKNGLTVCVGFWLGHERHGFDYQDQNAVLKQLDDCLMVVRKYKDHPAVLIWTVGNEAEGNGNNPAVWMTINHIAREIKDIDPHHPTMTVIAELGENESKIKSIERFCRDIDIIGINAYGGINSVGSRFKSAGSSKPYIVTEHGPLGPWETAKTAWDSPIEKTSTEKASWYAKGYRDAVKNQPGICLGSYAFLWGSKQETTATWFGMLLEDGKRVGAADAMSEAWTGSPLKNKCPEIQSLVLDTTGPWKPGQLIKARAAVSDPEGDKLQYEWVLRTDSGTIGAGGDRQQAEKEMKDLVKSDTLTASVTAPKRGGGYRLFLYAYDDQGGAAVANVPFLVDAPIGDSTAPKAELPYTVYGDDAQQKVFIPSGYMGNAKAVAMDLLCPENPHEGKTCLKIEYKSTQAWGGVLWQSPADDWDGKQPGGLNFSGAKKLEFWVRGAAGGEKVNFVMGGVGGSEAYRDTAKAEMADVTLTEKWQKLEFVLEGKDLSRIKTVFGWSLAGQAKPVTFYVDNIRFVAQ